MGQPPWQPRCGAWPALLFAALVLYGGVAGAVDVSVPCNGGYRGVESGTLVAVMPPDVPSPTGGLASPGVGTNGLILGDTHGRTPGSYGFFIACDVQGYLGPTDVVSSATIVLTQGGSAGIDPLGPDWTSSAGPGPAKLAVDMVSQGVDQRQPAGGGCAEEQPPSVSFTNGQFFEVATTLSLFPPFISSRSLDSV